MVAPIRIRRGMDIRLAGAPAPEVHSLPDPPVVALYPPEFDGVRPRLLVEEGAEVRRGDPLIEDKRNPALKLAAPAGGRVLAVRRGERRAILAIEIERSDREETVDFGAHSIESIDALSREAVLERLLRTGLLALIRQRPFSHMADPENRPAAIFVNGMNTAPFTPDLAVALEGREAAFAAGLRAMARLTDGLVHLCLAEGAPAPEPPPGERLRVHRFSGPHPAGNTSVHIHHIDPIREGRKVWTVRGEDLVLIGELLLGGALPTHRVIALGGPGVRESERRHLRVRIGSPLGAVLEGRMVPGETRAIAGDALSGRAFAADEGIGWRDTAVTVVPEGRERAFLGWLMPGWRQFSHSRTFLSAWLGRNRRWDHTTNLHGSPRAMILTGLYDRVMPMRILTDFLVRAVLAHDVDEAVRLGLLETDPEDFALPAFLCPSKTDLPGIIRAGLAEAEAEGL